MNARPQLRVFVSHSSHTEQARELRDAVIDGIESVTDVKAVVDQREIKFGDKWQARIAGMIEGCHGTVTLLTPDAAESDWVRYESHLVDARDRLTQWFKWWSIQAGCEPGDLETAPWSQLEISRHQMVKSVDPEEVKTQVRDAVEEWAKDRAAILAQRRVYLEQLPTMGLSDLFGREDELRILDEAWPDPKTRVVTFRAFGGVGKSALIRRWLAKISEDDYLGAERTYGWSFYSQGTTDKNVSADPFLQHALRFFGDPRPEEGSPSAKGERLAELILRVPTLLVLDGLEPLQFPPGENEGRLKDKGLASLLNALARSSGRGLCVITTRVTVTELHDLNDSFAPEYELGQLDRVAGRQLLHALGVKGSEAELESTSESFGGHSLALVLLGNFLREAHGGEIVFVDRVDQLIHDERQGGHARRVMESYVRWFRNGGRDAEVEVLLLMGLFDRPAEGEAIEALRRAKLARLTEKIGQMSLPRWNELLVRLRSTHLIAPPNEAERDALDAHPLVREHFGAKLATEHKDGWIAGHERLYDHFSNSTEEYPNDSKNMERLYSSVNHACAANRDEEAFTELIKRRAWRLGLGNVHEEFFATRKLGLTGADFVALSQFFEREPGEPIDWRKPSSVLSTGDQLQLLTDTGVRLRMLGRIEESKQCFAEVVHRIDDAGVTRAFAEKGAYAAAQHSELLLIGGGIDRAKRIAQRAIRFADGNDRAFHRMHSRTSAADAHMQLGEREEAERLFGEAQEIARVESAKQKGSDLPFMYSQTCYRYSAFLLDRGEHGEVIKTAKGIKLWGLPGRGSLLSRAIDHTCLGEALLARDIAKTKQGTPVDVQSDTESTIQNAVSDMKESGYSDYLTRALVIRIRMLHHRRSQDDLDDALVTVAGALRECERGHMLLLRVDVDLEHAWVLIHRGAVDEARHLVQETAGRAETIGYRRAQPRIDRLRASLGLDD